jgi:hypothetical protein
MTDLDFSSIAAAVVLTPILAGMIALGAVKIAPNATKWAVNKLASFF